MVENFLSNEFYGVQPLKEFIYDLSEDLDEAALDWLNSLPASSLKLYEIVESNSTEATAVLLPYRDDPKVVTAPQWAGMPVGAKCIDRIV